MHHKKSMVLFIVLVVGIVLTNVIQYENNQVYETEPSLIKSPLFDIRLARAKGEATPGNIQTSFIKKGVVEPWL